MNIQKPTLVVDKEICLKNISKMLSVSQKHLTHFRPHFKTHQSAEIGEWHKDLGIAKITVSSNTMAQYFAKHGWNDITVAFPVNLPESDLINYIASKIKLNITISTPSVLPHLNKRIKKEVSFFIEIDSGDNRSGIAPFDFDSIEKIIEQTIGSYLHFKGFLTHSGHSYRAKTKNEIISIHEKAVRQLTVLKERYINQFPAMELSIGDTPSCSLASDFGTITEIRPGNYIFNDLMQLRLGSCELNDIAIKMVCPVVAKYPERNELLIYGGAVHFSKDFVEDENGNAVYGCLLNEKNKGGETALLNACISRLSQEHGVVSFYGGGIDSYSVGDIANILPIHACLTASCMKEYHTSDGKRIRMMS